MNINQQYPVSTRPTHDWLRKINLAYVPGYTTPLIDDVAKGLVNHFRFLGHKIQDQPDNDTDIILTSAPFGEPLKWRGAMLFTARVRYKLDHIPTIFTIVHAPTREFEDKLAYYSRALQKDLPDPSDFVFPGLAPSAYKTLYEQGRRGGPILALMRTVQTQALSIRVLLLVGDDRPREAYTFDLVGAYPRTDGSDPQAFYEDLVYRMLTAVSTTEVTAHKVLEEPVSREMWNSLSTPVAMRRAGIELGKRNFFTEMVRIADLVHVPAIDEAVSSQYSEGCFTTWDPQLSGLITTVTGSARPIDKDKLTDDELAIIVGVRPDGLGAVVRHVEGKRNDPPSSEAVEMIEMDLPLPRITVALTPDGVVSDVGGAGATIYHDVPVARSKLHGHRGVRAYDPDLVEHVSLDEPFYHYPVSCSTEAQARAIKAAFSRSQALNRPEDPRQVVFTVLPGHGIVIAEKWVPGKLPFQMIWETIDAGFLQVENHVPQGPLHFEPDEDGMMVLRTF